jgi:hypothetical protein
LVISGSFDKKLSYALEMTNNIQHKYYSVHFRLRDTP